MEGVTSYLHGGEKAWRLEANLNIPGCYKEGGGFPHKRPHRENKAQHKFSYGENNQ